MPVWVTPLQFSSEEAHLKDRPACHTLVTWPSSTLIILLLKFSPKKKKNLPKLEFIFPKENKESNGIFENI
jgi:hypothetical protein